MVIARTSDRSDLTRKIFGSEQAREKIRIALGPKRFQEFEAFAQVENTMDLLRGAMGNSTTVRQLVELGAVGSGAGGAAYAGTGDPTSAFVAGLAAVAGKRMGQAANQNVLRRVGEMLISQDPAQMQRAIKVVQRNKGASDALRQLELTVKALGYT